MSDNSAYPFGLDFYGGNSVRSWDILTAWNKHPGFAYFRLGIGLLKDAAALHLMDQAYQAGLKCGGYYELWLPDVSKDQQAQTIRDQLGMIGVADALTLPLWLVFEEQTEEDKHGVVTSAFPSVGDLQFLMGQFPGALCYTNEAGLKEIKRVLGAIPAAWAFALADYLDDRTQEMAVSGVLEMAAMYGIDAGRVMFAQVCDAGAYPAGASYDKGADYDRAVSYQFENGPAASAEALYRVNVTAPARLNIRSGPGMSADIIGDLPAGSEVTGTVENGWLHLSDSYVSADLVQKVSSLPAPAPIPTPAPVPTPTPSPDGLGLYYLRTRPEFNKADPQHALANPDPGSFSQIGGRGQDNWVQLGGNEDPFIYSLGSNRSLVAWSQGGGKIYRTDIGPGLPWPVILAASITGQPRNMVKVLQRLPGGYIQIEAIARALDYSSITPETHPWLFGTLGTIYPDGHDGPGVHNGLSFIMPYFDPTTFSGPAGRKTDAGGLIVLESVLFGPAG